VARQDYGGVGAVAKSISRAKTALKRLNFVENPLALFLAPAAFDSTALPDLATTLWYENTDWSRPVVTEPLDSGVEYGEAMSTRATCSLGNVPLEG
jgi:hypothetical protein